MLHQTDYLEQVTLRAFEIGKDCMATSLGIQILTYMPVVMGHVFKE